VSNKVRHGFEPNKITGNPVPAPSRGVTNGCAGASRHVGIHPRAPLVSKSMVGAIINAMPRMVCGQLLMLMLP
jgi:hypothetical protein